MIRAHTEKQNGRSDYRPAVLLRVTDGARTRDIQIHNLVLYQLNYGHHAAAEAA